jgi:malonyl-CoA/methylmalonyl-CoA synthetase
MIADGRTPLIRTKSMANPLFDALFQRNSDKDTPFLILPDGREISHRAFQQQAARYAHLMQSMGLVAGDRVAAQIAKSPEALALYAACVQSGLVFLPLNTGYTPAELAYFLEDSGALLFIGDDSKSNALSAVATNAGARFTTLNADGSGDFTKKAVEFGDLFQTVSRTADDLAALLYTSGTTGRSKGAMLSQRNLLSNAQTLAEFWRFNDKDVLLHALPIFHTHGLFVATNICLLTGGTMIFLPSFDLNDVVRLMPQASCMMGVPTFYTRLLGDERFTRDLAQHMRLFISGSAPLLAETHTQFELKTGHRILERYGMTETNMNTSNPYDGARIAGTVGLPLPGVELKVTDPATGISLPDGEVGQIEVRGDNVFHGYWNMPEKTRAELRDDGFFITGDLGVIDLAGYVQIVGRNKDLIISGGYNIYPKELELLLDAQPGILESAVIGVPHPDFGESAVGILVAKPSLTINLNGVNAALATSLARFKCPQRLFIVPELPRNTMGKVQKNLLRDQFRDCLKG